MKTILSVFLVLSSMAAQAYDTLGTVQKQIDLAGKNVRVAEARMEFLETHKLNAHTLVEEVLETREYTATALEILEKTWLTQMDDQSSGNRMKHFRKAKASLAIRARGVNTKLAALLETLPVLARVEVTILTPETVSAPVIIPAAEKVIETVAPVAEENEETDEDEEESEVEDEEGEEEQIDQTAEVAQ